VAFRKTHEDISLPVRSIGRVEDQLISISKPRSMENQQ